MIVLWFSLAWGSDCLIPAYSTDLTRAVADAEATFSSLDIDAFKAATDRLEVLLPCLVDPVPRNVAATVHRYLGIRAVGDRDMEVAELRFAAGRALEPGYSFPETLMPVGHPVRRLYDGLQLSDVTFATAPPPGNGYVQFDGRSTNQRPLSWATILQRFDSTGKIVETAYLMPAEPLPQYPVRIGQEVVVVPYDDPVIEEPPRPTGLIVATGVAAVATGVLYTVAGLTHGKYMNPETPDGELAGLAGRANGLSVASAVTGTATLGLGVGLVLRL
jgi:hypothetical protein